MPGLSTDQTAAYLKDMYKCEREGYDEEKPRYPDIYKVVTGVTGTGDKVTQLLGAGTLIRHTTEDQKIAFKSPVQSWEFLVKYWMYSDGLSLTKSAVEDTTKLGNMLKDLAATWGRQVRIVKEEMGARVFNQGGKLSGDWVFNGSHTGNTAAHGDLMYDNRPLFVVSANNHPLKIVAIGTASGTGTLYNSVAAATSLTTGNFETIYALHTSTNNRDERNQIISNPADTLLVKTGGDFFDAKTLMDSELLPGGANNDKNVYRGLCNVLDWAYLSDTTPIYIGKAKHPDFQFHERQGSELDFHRDHDNLSYKVSINIRIGVLLKNWRCWTRGGGTSAA